MASHDADERRLIASIAAHTMWARQPNRKDRGDLARQGLLARFTREVDPNGTMNPRDRALAAESMLAAHYRRMALKSAQARRARKLADQLDAEVDAMAGGAA